MSSTVYTLTEAKEKIPEKIPETWQLFRGAYIQSIALDYVMSTCIPKLLQTEGLVTSIANPYSIKFDYDMLDMLLHSYKNSHVDIDYLFSTNRNELERGKKQLRNFIYNYSLANREWSINSNIGTELSGETSSRTYRITVTGPTQTGSEKIDRINPSYIEIIILDDGNPDNDPSRAQLIVHYQGSEGKEAKDEYKLYVNKGTLPRVEEALLGAEILIREAYLSGLENSNGKVTQAYLRYATARVLQELFAYSQLATGVFHGILYPRTGSGECSRVSNDTFYAKMEEVLGEGGEDEIRQFFREVLLPSIGSLADDDAVISAILPDAAFHAARDGVGVRENVRKYPPDPERVIKNAGLAVAERRFLELSGQDAPQGIQNLGRLLGHIMSSLIKSEPNIAGLIDEWDTDLNTMIEQARFPHPTADQERFGPEAIKIVVGNFVREDFLESGSETVPGPGVVAIDSLRENQTHGQYLKTVRSLKYTKKEDFVKMQGGSLDYSKVYWDERDTPHQARFIEILLDMESHWDDIYEVCLRLEGRQRHPEELRGAVYTRRLHGEETTSILPIGSEMSKFEKDFNAELRSAQKPGWVEKMIKLDVGGRI